jgi:hypothetical protein
VSTVTPEEHERRQAAPTLCLEKLLEGISGKDAWRQVARQLPSARRNPSFADALARLWPGEAT